ncbi:MAG: hypothetical protein LUG95_01755, partial [Clostridiales bacterium]|nr:hypothetical protein [Clostridiales bacterium]
DSIAMDFLDVQLHFTIGHSFLYITTIYLPLKQKIKIRRIADLLPLKEYIVFLNKILSIFFWKKCRICNI